MENKLFIYGVTQQEFDAIKKAITCASVYALDDSILNETVGDVVDIPYLLYKVEPKDISYMILKCEDTASAWKSIIDQLRPVQLSSNPVKITVTESNRKWPMHILFEHVAKEHALFGKQEELRQTIISVSNYMVDKVTDQFAQDLATAFAVYNNQESNIDQVNAAINLLNQYQQVN